MKLKPIKKRKKVYKDIIEQIQDAILEGRIKPGERLPSERNLAESLQVSRQSVKEAVTVLETAGIITIRPGVGMYLNEQSDNEILLKLSEIIEGNNNLEFIHLIELRQAIEGDAAYYAATRMTEEQRRKFIHAYEQLVQTEEKVVVAIEEDFLFHYTIVEAANNPVLLDVMNMIADRIILGVKESREHSIKDVFLNKAVIREHENIFTAIMNKEPEMARQAMWEHHQGIKQRHMDSMLRMEDDDGSSST